MEKSTVQWPQYLAGLAAAGGAFAFGAGAGWSSPASTRLVYEDQYFLISQSQFDWAVSVFTLGAAISCLPIGFLMKKFGRRRTMLWLVAPFIIGWILVTFARNFEMLFCWTLDEGRLQLRNPVLKTLCNPPSRLSTMTG
jgi:predicted MFS family arabinose efflux permease